MNYKQKTTVVIAAIVALIMILFPPWEVEMDVYGDNRDEYTETQYRFIFGSDGGSLSYYDYSYGGKYAGRVNVTLLLVQLIIVAGAAYFVVKRQERSNVVSS